MKFIWAILGFALSACMHVPSPVERRTYADGLAKAEDWRAEEIAAGRFNLLVYSPTKKTKSDALTIYIEGDGFAWINSSQPSADPTPLDPLALRLALAQPDGNAAYLARPCQYVGAEATECSPEYWTEKRFAPEVIVASNIAIDRLKLSFSARHLTLVGYSGGGAVAALLAARRSDVIALITVAGNLDHHAWTRYHHIQPLDGSLNPADEIPALLNLRQMHWVGARDRIVPPVLIQGFANKFPLQNRPRVKIEADFDHRCCWVEAWPKIWQMESIAPSHDE